MRSTRSRGSCRLPSPLAIGLFLGVVLCARDLPAEMPSFQCHVIAELTGSTGQTSLVDVDHDGDLDWIVGQRGRAWWFEYRTPGDWKKHDLGEGATTDVGGCAFDVDGDGWVDQVSGTAWYRNTGKPRQEKFQRYDNGAMDCHDDIAADVDGDGKLDVVAVSNNPRHVVTAWYSIPDDPREKWTEHRIGKGIHGGIGPRGAGDLDGDGDTDIVRGNVWFENLDGKGERWKEHPALTPPGGSRPDRFGLALKVWVCDLDRDGDSDIIEAEADCTDGRTFWFENGDAGKTWTCHLISSSHTKQDFHSLAVADFDNDGDVDVSSGGGPLSQATHRCFIWENLDGKGGAWKEHVILTGKRCHEAVAADVDHDGDVDICTKPWRGTQNIYLENQLVTASSPTASSAAARPNVIFILADDLGWSELGCYGNTFNETPNLDRLARGGMRFTQAYAAAPVCSPFRASLMTGQWPARVGITDYLRPGDPNHLARKYTTIAELFKKAGYATGMVGKWHLSGYESHGVQEVRPTDQGFDEALVTEEDGIGGGSYFFPYHFNEAIRQRIHPVEHLVDRMNLEAVEFIERHKKEPFFLYQSHYAVHTKLAGRGNLVQKYRKKPGAGDSPLARRNNVHLAAQLEAIDDGVGDVLRKLRQLGLADRTLVIFMSDNGGETRVTTNAPLRGGKSMLYEGGIREPLIVWWPGKVPAGSVCGVPVASVDFFPTIAAILGVKTDAAQVVDGVSLLPLWKNPRASLHREALYWHYPLEKPHFLGGRSSGAIRLGDFKLIEYFNTGKLELFNLRDDIGEKHDFSARMPGKVRELHERLKAWRAAVGARMAPQAR